jgi:hypothetical protein
VQKQREEEAIEWLSGDKCFASEGERESDAVFTVDDFINHLNNQSFFWFTL